MSGEPSSLERGMIVAAVRALGAEAPIYLADAGPGVVAMARELSSSRAALAREVARLDAVPLEGLDRVHPSWWQRPPSSSRPPMRSLLERWATIHLVPMPSPSPWSPGLPLAGLDGLPSESLVRLVTSLGRRRLAMAFHETSREALAQLCSRLGEPSASELLAEVKLVRPSHEEAVAAQRALFKLAVDAPDARSLFFSAGARWLAPALAEEGGDLACRVAQRLPVALGRSLLAETGAAATEADHRTCVEVIAQLLGPR